MRVLHRLLRSGLKQQSSRIDAGKWKGWLVRFHVRLAMPTSLVNTLFVGQRNNFALGVPDQFAARILLEAAAVLLVVAFALVVRMFACAIVR